MRGAVDQKGLHVAPTWLRREVERRSELILANARAWQIGERSSIGAVAETAVQRRRRGSLSSGYACGFRWTIAQFGQCVAVGGFNEAGAVGQQRYQHITRGSGHCSVSVGTGRGGQPRCVAFVAVLDRVQCVVNRGLQDCESARLRHRVRALTGRERFGSDTVPMHCRTHGPLMFWLTVVMVGHHGGGWQHGCADEHGDAHDPGTPRTIEGFHCGVPVTVECAHMIATPRTSSQW